MALAFVVLLCAAASGLGGPAGASAHRIKQVCSAPPPRHAACMAERLLIGAEGSPATFRAAASKTAKHSARTRRHAGINNKKPFPGFLTPERLHAAYGLPGETAAGSTQTIALVDAFNDPTAEADLAVYDKEFGLPECTSENGCFTKLNQEGKASPLPKNEGGWASEISIDVQMAHAICQSCRIMLIETKTEEFGDLGTGVNAAIAAGATVVSNSYGEGEEASLAGLGNSDYNHPGVPVLASSGDCGYLNSFCAERTPGANFPADAPSVIGVGGTSLTESAGVWTSKVWEEGGSGCSNIFQAGLWQAELGSFAATGCATKRGVADVSAIGDPNTGVDVFDSTPEEPGGPVGWGVWGGTSVASPIVAGEFGLAGGGLGVSYPAATLYTHFGHASALYDVTAGNNGECAGATICTAAAGFDGPTGVGSPIGLEAFAIAGGPTSSAPPTITGFAEQGQTLTEHHGGWTGSPTSFTYQWERCGFSGANCHEISGAAAQTYTALEGDVGSTLRVRETAHNSIGAGSADSTTVGPVASNVPTITGLSTSSGITGSKFILEGTALDSASTVLLGKLAASFVVISPGKLEVTVPDGAKSGKLAVTTAHGSAKGKAKFTVTLAIASFKPGSGAAGASISIKGTGFTSSSTVAFAGTPAASVTFLSKSKLKATVPAGAASGPITVTNTSEPAGTVRSAATFTP
jgi:IPT/TIG domain